MKRKLINSILAGLFVIPLTVFAAHESHYEDVMYDQVNKALSDVMEYERDGSLKKPQVAVFYSRIEALSNRLDEDELHDRFTHQEAVTVQKTLQKIVRDVNQARQANLQ